VLVRLDFHGLGGGTQGVPPFDLINDLEAVSLDRLRHACLIDEQPQHIVQIHLPHYNGSIIAWGTMSSMKDIYDVFHRLVNPKPLSEPEQNEAHALIDQAVDARRAATRPSPAEEMVQTNQRLLAEQKAGQ
jgi:hypothetical protein